MNLLKKIFNKIITPENKSNPYPDVLHLWEDDYLMVELLPMDNLGFVMNETTRINEFGKEHFDGFGFTNVTPIGEKPVKTIEKLIYFNEVQTILINSGLEKIERFYMQGVGLLEGEKAPIGFGTNKFAVRCNKEGTLLKDIWVTGHTESDESKEKLKNALYRLGKEFDFIAVNWYRTEYFRLDNEESIREFIKNSC